MKSGPPESPYNSHQDHRQVQDQYLTGVLTTTINMSTHHLVFDLVAGVGVVIPTLVIGQHLFSDLSQGTGGNSPRAGMPPASHDGVHSSEGGSGVGWKTDGSDVGVGAVVNSVLQFQQSEVIVCCPGVVVRMVLDLVHVHPLHIRLTNRLVVMFSQQNLRSEILVFPPPSSLLTCMLFACSLAVQ